MSDLYDTDILLWSERQADLLRRHAAGERVNDASIDWPNIARRSRTWGGASGTASSPIWCRRCCTI